MRAGYENCFLPMQIDDLTRGAREVGWEDSVSHKSMYQQIKSTFHTFKNANKKIYVSNPRQLWHSVRQKYVYTNTLCT